MSVDSESLARSPNETQLARTLALHTSMPPTSTSHRRTSTRPHLHACRQASSPCCGHFVVTSTGTPHQSQFFRVDRHRATTVCASITRWNKPYTRRHDQLSDADDNLNLRCFARASNQHLVPRRAIAQGSHFHSHTLIAVRYCHTDRQRQKACVVTHRHLTTLGHHRQMRLSATLFLWAQGFTPLSSTNQRATGSWPPQHATSRGIIILTPVSMTQGSKFMGITQHQDVAAVTTVRTSSISDKLLAPLSSTSHFTSSKFPLKHAERRAEVPYCDNHRSQKKSTQ